MYGVMMRMSEMHSIINITSCFVRLKTSAATVCVCPIVPCLGVERFLTLCSSRWKRATSYSECKHKFYYFSWNSRRLAKHLHRPPPLPPLRMPFSCCYIFRCFFLKIILFFLGWQVSGSGMAGWPARNMWKCEEKRCIRNSVWVWLGAVNRINGVACCQPTSTLCTTGSSHLLIAKWH